MGLPLREAREVFEREYLHRPDQPLRRQHLAHRRVRRHGALGAAPQAEVAGNRLGAALDGACDQTSSVRALMSRIAYVNGRYVPHRDAMRPCRGPRLSVRRRRLRGLRGAGRPPRRRAPPHGPAGALARANCASRMPMPRSGARRRAARDRARATACATASSICRSPAASRGATMPFRRAGTPPSLVVTARSARPGQLRAGGRRRASRSSPCPRIAGPRRHQDGRRCCPTCWPSRRRASRAPREAWFVDADGYVTEGASSNAWIVTARRRAGHPRRPTTASCAASPARCVLDVIADARAEARGARLHGRGGLCGARGLHHLGEPDRHAGGADRRPAGRQRRARA